MDPVVPQHLHLALVVALHAAAAVVAVWPRRRAAVRDDGALGRQPRVDAWHLHAVVAARPQCPALEFERVLVVGTAAQLEDRREQRPQARRAPANYCNSSLGVRPDHQVHDAICMSGVSAVCGRSANCAGKRTQVVLGRIHVANGVFQPDHCRDAGTISTVSRASATGS